jgi:hypothetical protein
MQREFGKSHNVEQRDPLLQRALRVTQKILTEGEVHLAVAVQQKPIANILPHSIVVTNKRVILYTPKLFKATFEDYLWRDIEHVHLTDRFFGSKMIFTFSKGRLVATYLPKDQAKKVYAIAQAKEEEWVEKWRLRRIEEDRARSGANHIVIGKGDDHSGDGQGATIKTRLLELEALLQEGLITQDEYQLKKIEILELV